VRVTHRLTDSPACLVADEHDVSGNLARILKAAGQKAPNAQPILEINPKHPVVLRLKYEEKPSSTTGRRCCSTRPCSPRAASSTTRPPSSSA
jgi:HSP90 family molecular chaperone